jgi:hypothetical protein
MRIHLGQLRDEMANSLRGTLLITRPTLRCPNDEEAEAIARHVMKWLDREPQMLIYRAELNDGFVDKFREASERLEIFEFRYNQIKTAIAELTEAQACIDEAQPPQTRYQIVKGVAG